MEKDLNYYLSLAYTKVVRRDSEGDFVARILELDGCIADGRTEVEALEALMEAQSLWIGDALKTGQPIPEPAAEDDSLPSGKWLQRVPRSLHKKLITLAKLEGVSLNQFVTSALAEACGTCRAGKAAVASFGELISGSMLLHEVTVAEPGGTWVVDAKPDWHGQPDVIPREAMSYLDSLANQFPNEWQSNSFQLIKGQELLDAHLGRPRISELSKKRATVRGGTRILQRKG